MGTLDSLVALYGEGSAAMLARVVPLILPLHVALFTLQFGWDLVVWTLAGTERAFALAAKKLLVFFFTYGLIVFLPLWLGPFLSGWEWLGREVIGLPGLSPSGIFEQGLSLGFALFGSLDKIFSLTVGGVAFFRNLAFLIILAAFGLVAIQLTRILVEAAIALGGLPIFLAFFGHGATFGMAEGYLRYLVDLGVRTFVVFLVVGVGRDLGGSWNDALVGPGLLNPWVSFTILLSAIVFALLTWTLPGTVARHVAGGFTFSGLNPLGNRE